MPDLARRSSLLLGLGMLGAGPAVLGTNLIAAAAAFGPLYPWRFLAWGRKEDTVNDAYFPRRAIKQSGPSNPLPVSLDPERMRTSFSRIDQQRRGTPLPLDAFIAETRTTGLLVAQDDRLLFEAYANGAGPATRRNGRSMAKSVLALLIAIAIDEGRIPSLDVPLETLLPDIAGLRGSGVLLHHVMEMDAGLAYRGDAPPLGPLTIGALWTGWTIAYFVPALRDYLATARAHGTPGASFVYDDRSAMLVGLVLERAFHAPLSQTLAAHLWTPMGAEYSADWILNSTQDGLEKSEGGLDATARDWLKLAQLVLHDGGGMISPDGLARVTNPMPASPGTYAAHPEFAQHQGLFYGRLWWGFARDGAPHDSFAHGLYGQVAYVNRARRITMVRLGIDYGGVQHWPTLLRDWSDQLGAG